MVYTSLTTSSQQRRGIKKENLMFESLKEGLVISFSMYVLQPNPQAADGAFSCGSEFLKSILLK